MNLTFSCPRCDQPNRVELSDGVDHIDCQHCQAHVAMPAGAFVDGSVNRCLVCPSTDLFVRKDFPQRLGVLIVVVGIIGSSIAWGLGYPILTFGVLFATALVDVVLYALVPDALMCYRCSAMYRGSARLEDHRAFDLETHERYRQQAARLGAHQSASRPKVLQQP